MQKIEVFKSRFVCSTEFLQSIDLAQLIQIALDDPITFKDKRRKPVLYEIFEMRCAESAEDYYNGTKSVILSYRKKQ
jgi:hypothetical protein